MTIRSLPAAVLSLAVLFGCLMTIGPVFAQQFIEPTSPSGGSTAWPLNSSANAQYKHGTLIIGPTGSTCDQATGTGCAKLCLNTSNPNDPTNCIDSWSDLQSSVVHLQTALPSDTNPTNPNANPLEYGTPDQGFATIAPPNSSQQLYTLIAKANPTSGLPSTAVYASDGGDSANYAGQFNGRLYVGYVSGTQKADLCLNGTSPLSGTTGGVGCIKSWSDLALIATAGNYVVLQPLTAIPSPQAGQVAISGAGSFASQVGSAVVIGAPADGTSASLTCGDGICNGSENNTFGSGANYCPGDCDRTAPADPTSIVPSYTPSDATSTMTVRFSWTNPTAPDFAGIRIIRKRTGFAVSPYDTGDWVWTSPGATTRTVTDPSTLVYGTTYYYTFYSFDNTFNFSTGAQVRIYHAPVGCTSDCYIDPFSGRGTNTP